MFTLSQWQAGAGHERRAWRYSRIDRAEGPPEHRVFIVVRESDAPDARTRVSLHTSTSSAADALLQAAQLITSDPFLLTVETKQDATT